MKRIKLGSEEVHLDDDLLTFDEATINKFLQNYAAKYNYYAEKHAEAQYLHSCYQDKHDAIYAEKFRDYKEAGGSDKLAEAKATASPEVQVVLEDVRVSKHHATLLWGFLRSMDRAHENAMQLCYNMRKEMDKLYSTVKNSPSYYSTNN